MDEETLKKMQEQIKKMPTQRLHEIEDYRDTWRIFRIMAEFVEGYSFLSTLKQEVTIFGSARFPEDHIYYQTARALGGLLGQHGFTTITGGGPGIMEAANRGADEAKGESVGLNIQLPFEQRTNPYVQKSAAFYYFFTRKVMLTSPANAFVFFPGGFGTLDEFFEVTDLMDLQMLSKAPVILVGSTYWQPLITFLQEQCCEAVGSLSPSQIDSWHIVDRAEDAFEIMKDVKDVKNVCDLSPTNFHCEGNIDWKIFRVMAELVEGFDFITGLEDAVTVLGTKTAKPGSPYYEAAYQLGQLIAQKGFSVVTGAKSGTAEAANKGAFEMGGTSIGIGMRVGKSAEVNPYLNKSILFYFPFTRKLVVTAPTKAFVFFPGGLGTMHQLFEILTLIQTKKMPPVPVVLYDRTFWQPLHEFIKKILVHDVKTIADKDDELYHVVDDVESVMKIVGENHRHHPA